MPAITAFIDLSHLAPEDVAEGILESARADRLGGIVSRVIVHLNAPSNATLPPGWMAAAGVSPTQACQWAFDTAAQANTHLLVLAAGAHAGCEAIGALVGGLDLDPLFGVAIPRVSDNETGRILVTEPFGTLQTSIPRRVLASLTDYRVLTESLAPCMLFRREVAANLGLLGDPQRPLWDALAELAIRIRRVGFRTVLCNKVVVDLSSTSSSTSWGCSPLEMRSLQAAYPELTQLEGRASGANAQNGERILGIIADAPDSLLLDARNLGSLSNGTSRAILGICDALHRARPDSGIGLWVNPDAMVAHALDRRFPNWTVHHVVPETVYAAAFRLSQPWRSSEVESLERLAGVTMFWILDTIAWDIAYSAPDGLDAVWQHIASEADGLLFISDFSRHRFETRFCCRQGVERRTCRLSLDPKDYVRRVWGSSSTPYWFVIGNSYHHKHIAATVDLLVRSFPRKPLLVLGDRHQPRTANVTRFDSGNIDEETMASSFARAEAIIFPSFYEGFGLPIVEGLSYGRTVIARASSLVDELAAEYVGPGRLLTFSTERELIDLLNELEQGRLPEGRALGEGRTGPAWTWDSAAGEILEMTKALVQEAPSRRMLRRTGLSRGLGHAKCDRP